MNLKTVYFWPILLLMPLMICGQDSFEGRIILGVSIEGPYAEQMKPMMPSTQEFLIKDSQMKIIASGGMMPSMLGEDNDQVEMIFYNDKGEGYLLQHSAEVVYTLDSSEEDNEVAPEVTPSSETAEIAGYTCKKYVVTITANGGTIKQEIWATKDIQVQKPDVNTIGNAGQILLKGIDGFPLKVVSEMPMGAGTMTMMAQEVLKEGLSSNEFDIPSEYTQKEFDAAMLMGLGK